MSTKLTIAKLRQQVQELDRAIIELAAKRMVLAKDIALEKQANNLQLRDHDLEASLIKAAALHAKANGCNEALGADLLQVLIRHSVAVQQQIFNKK